MISYDLETCLLKKGKKRKDVLILSIGAVDIMNPARTFHCYVNPLASGKAGYLKDFEEYGARMKPTKTVIRNIRWRHDKAIMPEKALCKFQEFIDDTPLILQVPIVVAHNGRSFDHKIVHGAYARANMTLPDIRYLDSLHDITRKCYKKKQVGCFKLGVLHGVLCPKSTLEPHWHEALDDAKALTEIITATAIEHVARMPKQACVHATRHRTLLEAIEKDDIINMNVDCKRSMILWPGVVRMQAAKCNSFKRFALHFALNYVWKEYIR
jgi:DNA polymerase III epsilon subunit-like protein